MKSKKLYPSLYKWAYATGSEEEILEKNVRDLIPRQTIYNWRKIDIATIQEFEKELEIRELIEQNSLQC
jgi:hypothetical protein